ncbi:MAG: hypothetical protein ACRDHD_09875, partial [Candidatus Limnocylindria bacterium]
LHGGDRWRLGGRASASSRIPVEEAKPLLAPRERARAVEEGFRMGLEELIAYARTAESGS